jgi:hypothetical protein
MRKRWLPFLILSVLALGCLGAAAQQTKGTIRGYVFLDSNRDGVFDPDEPGIPGVFVTIAFGDYQHTYYTGDDDPTPEAGPGLPDPSPGPGSYGPTPLPSGYWKVTLHVPDGYKSTTPSELFVNVPEGRAATGVNFGIFGSGPITYSSGTGVGMGGAAGAGMLPETGGLDRAAPTQLIALFAALVGFLALVGTPWCVAQTRRVPTRRR